jgi:hypothetical protein
MIPSKSEYYGEDYTSMSFEDCMELSLQESYEACGILWSATQHIQDNESKKLLNKLRDDLIEDKIQNGEDSEASRFSTLWLYRKNRSNLDL